MLCVQLDSVWLSSAFTYILTCNQDAWIFDVLHARMHGVCNPGTTGHVIPPSAAVSPSTCQACAFAFHTAWLHGSGRHYLQPAQLQAGRLRCQDFRATSPQGVLPRGNLLNHSTCQLFDAIPTFLSSLLLDCVPCTWPRHHAGTARPLCIQVESNPWHLFRWRVCPRQLVLRPCGHAVQIFGARSYSARCSHMGHLPVSTVPTAPWQMRHAGAPADDDSTISGGCWRVQQLLLSKPATTTTSDVVMKSSRHICTSILSARLTPAGVSCS